MSGYRKHPTYRLTFRTPALDGLEVRMRGLSLEQHGELMGLLAEAPLIDYGNNGTPEELAVRERLMELTAEKMVSWNVTDDDEKLCPINSTELMELGYVALNAIYKAWTAAMIEVDEGKEPRSSGGSPLAEASIPMETLSESRAS